MRHLIVLIASVLTVLAIAGPALPQLASPEELVAGWYHRYLRRDPDPTGFLDHVRALRSGMPAIVVESEFLGSEEYYRLNGANPRHFVLGVYRDVLGRPPSGEEFAYWLTRVRDQGRAGTARSFLAARGRGEIR